MRHLLSLLLPLPLAACTSYTAPRLSLESARISEQSTDASVVQFTLSAENPSHVELPLSQISYTLLIDGQEVFRGVRSPEATLRRLGSQSFTIPAVIRGAAPPAGHPFTLQGTLEYTTPGSIAQILFDTGVSRPSIPFQSQGQIPAPEASTPTP
jgi:hypothetical protein